MITNDRGRDFVKRFGSLPVALCPGCGLPPTVGPDLSGYAIQAYCPDCYDLGAPIGHALGLGRPPLAREMDAIESWNTSVELNERTTTKGD